MLWVWVLAVLARRPARSSAWVVPALHVVLLVYKRKVRGPAMRIIGGPAHAHTARERRRERSDAGGRACLHPLLGQLLNVVVVPRPSDEECVGRSAGTATESAAATGTATVGPTP